MNMEQIDDCGTPVGAVLSAKYKLSYAYTTVRARIPIILNKIIENLEENNAKIIHKFGPEARKDLVTAKIAISLLINEVETNKAIVPLTCYKDDVTKWNKYLWQQHLCKNGDAERWFYSSWIYVECYMYRRIQQIFDCSYSLKSFDPFWVQKKEELDAQIPNIVGMTDIIINQLNKSGIKDVKREFLQFMKMALWGNHCDLSRSMDVEYRKISNPLESIEQLQSHILVDDSEKVWETINGYDRSHNTIDIVTDNAGYELFCDLCLADFLCTYTLASVICFHVKAMPWFISDATIHDFNWLLQKLEQSSAISLNLPKLVQRWQNYLKTGRWVVKNENYWTLPHTYDQMKETDDELYHILSKSTLVIFKGDVNYRKLMGEKNWSHTESFAVALQGFHPTNLVALRVVKAEIICGLKNGQAEELSLSAPNWMLFGDYAVIQFDGKQCAFMSSDKNGNEIAIQYSDKIYLIP